MWATWECPVHRFFSDIRITTVKYCWYRQKIFHRSIKINRIIWCIIYIKYITFILNLIDFMYFMVI